MNKLIISIYSLLLMLLSSCVSTKADAYKECKEQVKAINEMRLYRTYLVPVDSLGEYVYRETVFSGMYDRCILIANQEDKQVCIFATLYFDETGKVRKSVQYRSDGGDLNHVAYYDERGTIVYAVYANVKDDFGRLYSQNSRLYIEHSFSESWLDNTFLSAISMTTAELAANGKVDLQMPERCKSITFQSIQKGNVAFLCANNVYAVPGGAISEPKDENVPQAWFGRMVYVDSVADGWCRLKVPTFDAPLGYASVDSLEFYIE